ncbi:hypothetical protein BDN67DRAFT_974145 [Paxillus ammoniavirescens]|nr:hypothetical protein BDN67DRAFT_974145 [Paxillus ammoniavirescens]
MVVDLILDPAEGTGLSEKFGEPKKICRPAITLSNLKVRPLVKHGPPDQESRTPRFSLDRSLIFYALSAPRQSQRFQSGVVVVIMLEDIVLICLTGNDYVGIWSQLHQPRVAIPKAQRKRSRTRQQHRIRHPKCLSLDPFVFYWPNWSLRTRHSGV